MKKFAILFFLAILPLFTYATEWKVHRFHEPGVGSVNTWIVEGDGGVVIVDAQRTMQAGRLLAERIKKIRKPLLGVLVSHPHPDHVGGLPTVLEAFPGTPVYASRASAEEMGTDSLEVFAFARRVNGDAFPAELAEVTNIISGGDVLRFGNIVLNVIDIGPGEAIAMNVFFSREHKTAFVGDVLDNDMKGYLLERRTTRWLEQIAFMRDVLGETGVTAYPGHGDSALLSKLLDHQQRWIEDFHALVKARLDDGTLTDDEIASILVDFERRHPDQLPVAPIPGLMKLNAKAIAGEMLSHSK